MDPERIHGRDRPSGPRCVASVREVRLPSRAQLWKSLATLKVYMDSLKMVFLMVRQSLFSGAVALASNLVFTQGMFWMGKAPDRQSYSEFVVATMVNVSLVIALAMVLAHSAPLAKFHHTSRPDVQRSPLFWFWLVLRSSSVHCVVSTVLVALIAYAITFTDPAWYSYQLQFYAGSLVINYCTAAIDISARSVFQSQTVEGFALGHVNRLPLWRRLVSAYCKDFGFVIAVFIASAYIHVSSQLQLDSQYGLIVFSLASMSFRIVTMRITRIFILRLKKVHVRVLYVLTTVPTVLINTQVRVALLRVQANVSMTGVVVLALIEPVMRFFKVWSVRQEILHKAPATSRPRARLALFSFHASPPPRRSHSPATNAIAVMPSSTAEAVKPVAGPGPPVVADSHRWARRLLQFTAAEIHADMCSEYIAIACSMSIYYCLEGNAKFAWNADEKGIGSGGGGGRATVASRVELVLVQLIAEVAVDFACCVWELVNGIPLRTAPGLNGFLGVVFAGCAVTNIALCCSFYLRPMGGGMARALLDAVHAVGEVLSQSLISGSVAFAITLLCALGFFWSGRPPAQQTRVEFLVADMVYLGLFFSVSLILGFSAPLAKHRWVRAPDRAPSHRFWLARLVRATWAYGLLAAAWIVGVTVASTTLSDHWKPFALHFYGSALAVQFYLAVVDVAARTLYRTETTEGLARSRPPSRKPSSMWRRITRSYVDNIGFLLSVYAASIYIHLSSRLNLENQETFVVFSVASILLRAGVMKVLLWIVTRRQKIHIRLLYVLTSVPTVMIGTQVRVALLRVMGSVSVTSVVVLALVEPLMRLVKVWRVRREIEGTRVGTATTTTAVISSSRPRSESRIVPSDVPKSIRVKPSVRRRSVKRMPSRLDQGMTAQLLLQFTAAEIHADMCSEYIAIASSLAIFYCLSGHPRFSWTIQSSTTSADAPPVSPSGRFELVLLQIAVELVIDTACCLWEIVHGIPLRTSKELNRFLSGLFAGCAVTNICVCCAIYVR